MEDGGRFVGKTVEVCIEDFGSFYGCGRRFTWKMVSNLYRRWWKVCIEDGRRVVSLR
jgi:hypothetical protein